MGLQYLNTTHARRTLLTLENAEECLIGWLSHKCVAEKWWTVLWYVLEQDVWVWQMAGDAAKLETLSNSDNLVLGQWPERPTWDFTSGTAKLGNVRREKQYCETWCCWYSYSKCKPRRVICNSSPRSGSCIATCRLMSLQSVLR